MAEDKESESWDCGWEANRERKWTMALAATPAQRLAWLEEMIRIAWQSGALPKSDRERR